jgi:hypothetical protein
LTKAQQYIIISIIVFFGVFFWLSKLQLQSELPNAIGDPLELVVVRDSDAHTNRFYQTIKNLLNTDLGPSPQPESILSIIEIENNKFTGILQRHHNILIITKSDNFNIKFENDVFAKNQTVIIISCNSEHELISNEEKIRQLHEEIKTVEINRLITSIEKKNNNNLKNKILENHNVSMLVPNGFFLAHLEKGLTWIRRETNKLSQGVFLANIPPEMEQLFFTQTSIAIDSMIRPHILGPISGSYMITDKNAPVKKDTISINGIEMIKQQSLWRMKNDFMGGIYVSYIFHGSSQVEPFIIYTYLYSPGEPKKTPLIQLDAIVRTLSFKSYN